MRSIVLIVCLGWTAAWAAAQNRELVIFHTNDIHGHFAPEQGKPGESVLVGGFAALDLHLQELRKSHPNSIYLDAGDLMTGNPICNIEYNGVTGGALQDMLRRCGVSAECLGNHEFDLGPDHLRKYVAAAPYPLLSANLIDKSTTTPLVKSSQILNVNGLRIGVIGLILDDLAGVAARTAVEPFRVENTVSRAQNEIDELDPKTDVIILLTHNGVDQDSILASRIHGADIIVGGHSHTRLTKPLKVNGVLIVQAGSYLRYLGMLDLRIAGDSVSSFSDSLVELTRPAGRLNSNVAAFADSFEVAIQAKYGEVIGELAEPWTRGYYDQSNVGNWICDQLRRSMKSDVAFVNAGGIRADHKPGPITLLDVQEMLPFVNTVVTFNASGADLQKAAAEQASASGLHKHGVLEMSGLTIDYVKRDSTVQIKLVLVNGTALDPQKTYRIATIDYVAQSQWDEYLKFKPADLETTGRLISEVISEAVRANKGPLHSDAATRLREVKQ